SHRLIRGLLLSCLLLCLLRLTMTRRELLIAGSSSAPCGAAADGRLRPCARAAGGTCSALGPLCQCCPRRSHLALGASEDRATWAASHPRRKADRAEPPALGQTSPGF